MLILQIRGQTHNIECAEMFVCLNDNIVNFQPFIYMRTVSFYVSSLFLLKVISYFPFYVSEARLQKSDANRGANIENSILLLFSFLYQLGNPWHLTASCLMHVGPE